MKAGDLIHAYYPNREAVPPGLRVHNGKIVSVDGDTATAEIPALGDGTHEHPVRDMDRYEILKVNGVGMQVVVERGDAPQWIPPHARAETA